MTVSTQRSTPDWAAIVLAGGASRRMGGADKVALDVAGRTMLDRVLDAVSGAAETVVVGPRRDTARPVVWCREEPSGSGPAAAIRVGLDRITASVVLLLAGDQPLLDDATVDLLLDSVRQDADGAVAVDADDQPQWLCSAWHTAALRRLDLPADTSLRGALGSLRWGRVRVDPATAMDCDTPEDLRRVRELAE